MRKKFMSVFLCAMLTLQPSVIPSFAVKTTHNYQRKTTKNSKNKNSEFSRVLKYLCPSAVFAFFSYMIYSHRTNLPEKIKDFEKILDNYLINDVIIPPAEISKTCDEAIELLKEEPNLLKISGPTIIVGDIHADLGSLEYSIRKFLNEVQNGKSILFLGDYVDRGNRAPGGPNGIKNTYLILKLKTMFPNKVHLLRGNHENFNVNSQYGFLDECKKFYGENQYTYEGCEPIKGSVYEKFNTMFNYLSLAAVIDNSTFCVHGGISPELDNIEKINATNKPLDAGSLNSKDGFGNENRSCNRLAIDLLWSDPDSSILAEFYENASRGEGQLYNHTAVKNFLSKNKLKRIIRAHQEVDGHKDNFGDQSVITIFSAPNYNGGVNSGEIMDINGGAINYEKINYSNNKIVKKS